jgi:hypothetical protein
MKKKIMFAAIVAMAMVAVGKRRIERVAPL